MVAINTKETTNKIKPEVETKTPSSKKVVLPKVSKKLPLQKVNKQKGKPVKPKRKKAGFWLKDLLLAVVNLGFVVVIVVLLGRLPSRAEELKALRNAALKMTAKGNIDIAELKIESSKEKADQLFELFPDESGLIDFVKEIDKLKDEGIITRFSFASERAVRDKTGNFGIPLIIEFVGTWDQIDQAIAIIESLPYLLRVVNVDVQRQDEGDLIIFKYGGFIYVKESLAEN